MTVNVRDTVGCPIPPAPERLRDAFFQLIPALTLSAVRARESTLWLWRLPLLRFGAAVEHEGAWSWPIEGGVLARGPGGTLEIGWERGRLFSAVSGYSPRLPSFIFAVTQLPFHHAITRQFLLRLRGRLPEPGPPADPLSRTAAFAIDIALSLLLARLSGRRHRLATAGILPAAYHVAGWAAGGRTLGGAVCRTRLVAIDGSAVTVPQALIRLLTLGAGLQGLRARHDELAGTEVIRA